METIDRTAATHHREYGTSRKQVTRKALRHKTSVSVPWLAFEKRLAEAIGALKEDQYLVLSKKRGWGYVQFAAQGFYGIRGECVSNHYLDAAHALTRAQIDALGALGWLAPTGTPEEVRANEKKGGSPNHHRDFEGPFAVREGGAAGRTHARGRPRRVPSGQPRIQVF